MKYFKLIFLLIFMNTYSENIVAQDFSTHEWRNRLVLILTDDIDNEKYRNQVEELKKQTDEIKERKNCGVSYYTRKIQSRVTR